MELDLEVNPPNMEAAYLSGLNRCFADWGGGREYRWEFAREVGAPPADLLVLRDAGALAAGSAVVYRTVRTGQGDCIVGVMSGSWTLPEARGRGAFSRVIVESRRLVAEHGGAALIAFVTHDNASRRRLVAAGCREVPTHYLFSTPDTPQPAGSPEVRPGQLDLESLYRAHLQWVDGVAGAHLVYPSAAVWAGQFLERPLPVERVSVSGCQALVERSRTADRVLWLVGSEPGPALAGLLGRALGAGRQLFLFSVEARVAEAATGLGMEMKPGSITVLPASGDPAAPIVPGELAQQWRIQGGDRA
jgi:hypothetical protein